MRRGTGCGRRDLVRKSNFFTFEQTDFSVDEFGNPTYYNIIEYCFL